MKIALLLAASSALLAAGCSTTATTSSQASRPARVDVVRTVRLEPEDAVLIRSYYGESAARPGQGRGRGGNAGLPPGIEKNLARGKRLPPGIAKQYLPGHVLIELPPLPQGLEYVVVAGKLLLVEAATQVIREVLLDAVS